MKKIIVIFLLLSLTGCRKEPEFDYSGTVDNLISTYNTTHDCFIEDYAEEFYADKSSSYRNLMEIIYKDTTMKLKNASDSLISVEYLYWDYDSVYNSVILDTEGFIYDIKNFDSLGIAQSEINDYVYDYLSVTIAQCNKSTKEIDLEIEQTTAAPFLFISNEALYKQLDIDLSKLVYELEQYALGYAEEVEETPSGEELTNIEKEQTYLINYTTGEKCVPISIKVIEVLQGEEAKEKLLELSPNNETLLCDNLLYLEYEICNYSLEEIVFQSRFFDAEIETSELFSDSISFAGVSESYAIASGSTIVIRDLIVSNHDDLVWYDEHASELYILNQE